MRTNTNQAVFIIVLWSLAVHIPGVFSPLLDYHAYRQCQTASMARNYVRHGMHFLNPEVDTEGPPTRTGTEFPIYSYLLAGAYQVFGVHEILGRLLSMVFAAWGAVFLYLFVRRRLGERIGLWSALVMCAIPVHVYFTRSVQPEPMALWGLLGFLYYGDRWLFVNRQGSTWLCAVALGALAPLLKLPYLYILGPLWVVLGYERFGLHFLKNTAWWAALLGILFATQTWYAYAKTAPIGILPLSVKEHLANLAPILTRRLWQDQFISRVPELVTTYSGLLFALIGFYYYRKAKAFSFFAAWLFVCVLYVALLGEYGLIHRYTLLPLAPLAAVWIACGITSLWEHAKNNFVTKGVALLLILGIPAHAALRIAHWYQLDYPYVTRVHTTLLRVSQPNDLVLVASHEAPEILYYMDHAGYAVEPGTWRPEEVSGILHRHVRFVFLPEEDNRQWMPKWTAYLKTRAHLVEKDPEYLLYRVP
jgi:4-amino-4-deoxy-L-arabinose transferase-like glycosyltransferase